LRAQQLQRIAQNCQALGNTTALDGGVGFSLLRKAGRSPRNAYCEMSISGRKPGATETVQAEAYATSPSR
jgi:hypothetical protein